MTREELEFPWSTQETIENLKELKVILQEQLKKTNYEGQADRDVKEIGLDFDRAIESLEKQKTTKFDRMIEAFECDFSLIQQGEKRFAELDELMKDKRYSLAEHMDLMRELSYLIRHGKAEIYVKEGET